MPRQYHAADLLGDAEESVAAGGHAPLHGAERRRRDEAMRPTMPADYPPSFPRTFLLKPGLPAGAAVLLLAACAQAPANRFDVDALLRASDTAMPEVLGNPDFLKGPRRGAARAVRHAVAIGAQWGAGRPASQQCGARAGMAAPSGRCAGEGVAGGGGGRRRADLPWPAARGCHEDAGRPGQGLRGLRAEARRATPVPRARRRWRGTGAASAASRRIRIVFSSPRLIAARNFNTAFRYCLFLRMRVVMAMAVASSGRAGRRAGGVGKAGQAWINVKASPMVSEQEAPVVVGRILAFHFLAAQLGAALELAPRHLALQLPVHGANMADRALGIGLVYPWRRAGRRRLQVQSIVRFRKIS